MSALRRYLRALRTALRRPRAFFEECHLATDGVAVVGTVALVAAAVTVGVLLLGEVMAATVDATVVVENPERPPDWVCEQHGDDPDAMRYEDCQRPRTVERDVGDGLRSATRGLLHYGPLGVAAVWLLLGAALHVGARLVGGEGSVGETFAVVAWSLPAELLRLVAGVVGVWWALSTTDFAGGDLRGLESAFRAAFARIELPLLVVSVAVAAWQWHVWRGGLEARHDLARGEATLVAGVVALLAVVVAAT